MKIRAKSIFSWVVSFLIAGIFMMAGVTKVVGQKTQVEQFESWGYPHYFTYVVGVIELAIASTLLFPKLKYFGALGAIVVMLGAIITLIINNQTHMVIAPIIVLLLAILQLQISKKQ